MQKKTLLRQFLKSVLLVLVLLCAPYRSDAQTNITGRVEGLLFTSGDMELYKPAYKISFDIQDEETQAVSFLFGVEAVGGMGSGEKNGSFLTEKLFAKGIHGGVNFTSERAILSTGISYTWARVEGKIENSLGISSLEYSISDAGPGLFVRATIGSKKGLKLTTSFSVSQFKNMNFNHISAGVEYAF